MKISLLAIAALSLFSGITFGQNYSWSFGLGTDNAETIYSIDTDAQGDVYSCGSFQDNLDFDFSNGTSILNIQGPEDIFIQKTSVDGNFIWAKSIGSVAADQARSIKVDGDGDVITVGSFGAAADFDPGSGSFNMSPFSVNWNGFAVKLNGNGDFIWAKQFGQNGNTYIECAEVDNLGNIYLGGFFENQVDLDPNGTDDLHTSAENSDGFIVKLDLNGNFIWSHILESDSTMHPESISFDENGSIVVVGNFIGNIDLNPSGTASNFTSIGSEDMFILKLSDAGVFDWAEHFGSTGLDQANDVKVDAGGNIHISGGFGGTIDFDNSAGVFNAIPAGQRDIFVLKLNPTGGLIWLKQAGSSSFSEAEAIALDVFGNVYTTGFFKFNVDFDPSTSEAILDPTLADIFVWKLTSNGSFVWVEQLGGIENESALAVEISSSNDLYIGGYFEDSIDFNIDAAENYHFAQNDNRNMFLTKWGNCDNSVTQISQTACFEYTSPSGNTTYTASGIYMDTVSSIFGCDSILEINLTLNQLNLNISENAGDFSSDQSGATYQWLDCDNNFAVIAGATNQTFTGQTGIDYAVQVTYNGCTDTSGCANLGNIGIENEMWTVFEVYPNPTKNKLFIKGSLEIIQGIQITDILGRSIQNYDLDYTSGEIILNQHLTNGSYILAIQTEKGIQTISFIKQ